LTAHHPRRRNDLAYVTVESPMRPATFCRCRNLVRFSLSGPANSPVGSGAPNIPESFRQPRHTAYHGRCLAILRPLVQPAN